jgi:hypothetical protein
MIVAADPKDPDDTEDFTLDWANVLDTGETISTLAVTSVSGGLTVSSSSISGTETTARTTGGTAATDAVIRYRITTSASRQLDESLTIHVEVR